ncbi:phage holin family protein [Jinshanibacter sp. LJY008]|uniref:Phage holin family protein n=1 Tax=Limnobaculum eriocheiris TaxID=2897391 RepID=A0A9X1MVA2_9GAMM|nr:phage holin family protein [Limnobaculum eriocheiris]MCD1124830.1 phage holin family protein [Limnobaculum eriocheiris]
MRMDKYSSPASYFYSVFIALFGTLTLNDWAILVGIITGLGTFLVNWYYKRKDDKRKELGFREPEL